MLTHENQPVIYSTTMVTDDCDRLMTPVAIAAGVLDPDGPEDAMNKIIADAYLIAAAPEMLEDLKAVIDWANCFKPYASDEEEPSWIRRIRETIAKAEGKL